MPSKCGKKQVPDCFCKEIAVCFSSIIKFFVASCRYIFFMYKSSNSNFPDFFSFKYEVFSTSVEDLHRHIISCHEWLVIWQPAVLLTIVKLDHRVPGIRSKNDVHSTRLGNTDGQRQSLGRVCLHQTSRQRQFCPCQGIRRYCNIR